MLQTLEVKPTEKNKSPQFGIIKIYYFKKNS